MEKRPFIGKEQLEAICAEHPTPFHIYDEAQIRQRARALNAAFAWNPGFCEYFAVKATPNPWIVSILAAAATAPRPPSSPSPRRRA